MIFKETKLKGAFIVEPEKREDGRGFLTRTWCKEEFGLNGIDMDLIQGYISHTNKKGTMRGIHYQVKPKAEAKLTRCIKGSIFEVIIDLRKDSPTYKQWEGFALNASDNKILFVPEDFAHAILVLEDDTDFINISSEKFSSEFEGGIKYNDPVFNIKWPIPITSVSDKDLSWPDFKS